MVKRGNFTETYIDLILIFLWKVNAMQFNADEMWLNAMYVNALIFPKLTLWSRKNQCIDNQGPHSDSVHWGLGRLDMELNNTDILQRNSYPLLHISENL